MNKILAAVFLAIAFVSSTVAEVEAPPMMKITLGIGGVQHVDAEVARTPGERSQGLMFRQKLKENEGMLFVYPEPEVTGMWMKNTLIPLSVAFIDADGVIVNIEEMEPHTLDAHMATAPVKYSLEMNAGWFKKRHLGPGTKIKGLNKAPKPE
ncbi:MAG: DUF192 domain-containing protein [Burkholderiales bacterium]